MFFCWTVKDEGTLSHKSKIRSTYPARRSGPPAPPRSLRDGGQGWGACPGEKKRKPSLRCTLRWSSTCSTTRPSLGSATEVAQPLPSPSQGFGGNGPSHRTAASALSHPTPGMWSLSCATLPPEPRRRALRLPSSVSHPVSTASWAPCHKSQPVCDHLDPSSIEATESSHLEVAHPGV